MAAWSWLPQSQRREPKTSPVRHSEWMRTSGRGLLMGLAADEGDVVFAGQFVQIEMQHEIAVLGRHAHHGVAPDGGLAGRRQATRAATVRMRRCAGRTR
jgi:hypothetical protein